MRQETLLIVIDTVGLAQSHEFGQLVATGMRVESLVDVAIYHHVVLEVYVPLLGAICQTRCIPEVVDVAEGVCSHDRCWCCKRPWCEHYRRRYGRCAYFTQRQV
jgi:hypothetical protein